MPCAGSTRQLAWKGQPISAWSRARAVASGLTAWTACSGSSSRRSPKSDAWRNHQPPDIDSKAVIYDAFVRERIDAPKALMKDVDRPYFEPQHDEFRPRTVYLLQNTFTGAFHRLDPLPMSLATTSAGEYFAQFS
jgi:hypothetical protein